MELYSHNFFLTAADCGPQRVMTPDALVSLLIEVATDHANKLGIGFSSLIQGNLAWVLSRLALEIHQPLEMNTDFRVETWVESINRMFSERNFAIVREADSVIVAHARTTWMALDMDTRRPGDLSRATALIDAVNDRECPIERCGKLLPLGGDDVKSRQYEFVTSDIDVNRHVATRRYIDLMVDTHDLAFWDAHRLSRLEIAFKREARYGEQATVLSRGDRVDITTQAGPCALARIKFSVFSV